jgi:hypothetical protein
MPRLTSKATSWAAKFAELEAESREQPEKGYYTVCQWAEKLNRGYSQTLKLCRFAHKDGGMERKIYRVNLPSVGSRPVAHYRLIKGPQ